MTEAPASRIRGSYFLHAPVAALLDRVYGITHEFVGIGGADVPLYTVSRPWKRKKLVLGPFNLVPDYGDATVEVVDHVGETASRRGMAAELRVYGDDIEDLGRRFGMKAAVDSFETLIPLGEGMEQVYRGMRSRQRGSLRAAAERQLERGVAINRFDDERTLARFYRTLARSYRERHRMIPPPWPLLSGLLATQGPGHSAFGYVAEGTGGGEPLAGIFVLADETQWTYAWGGTLADARDLDLTSLLLHRAMQDAAAQRIALFSLGMTPLSHTGLAQYKRGWSTMQRSAGYLVRGGELPSRDANTDFRAARQMLMLLPQPVLNAVSPYLYRLMV